MLVARANVWLYSLTGQRYAGQDMWFCAMRRSMSRSTAVPSFIFCAQSASFPSKPPVSHYHGLHSSSLQLLLTDLVSDVVPCVSHESVFFFAHVPTSDLPCPWTVLPDIDCLLTTSLTPPSMCQHRIYPTHGGSYRILTSS